MKVLVKKNELWGSFILFLLCIFFIIKMFRSFSGSSVAGGIWNYIQLFCVAAGFVTFLAKLPVISKNSTVDMLVLFSAISVINTVIYISFDKNSLFSFLTIPYAACVLCLIYCDGMNRSIDNNIIITFSFYFISVLFLVSMLAGRQYSTTTGAVSDVYYILGLFPLMLIYNRKIPIIPIMICAVAIIVSGKRTGILAFIMMIFAYYLFREINNKSIKKHITNFFSLIIVSIIFVLVFRRIMEVFNPRLLDRLMNIFNDGGSGRSDRWQYVWGMLKQSSVPAILFGHGDNSLLHCYGRAHNDFLEVFYNSGLFALLSYIAFYILLIREYVSMVRHKYKYSVIMLMSIICSLFLAMLSFYIVEPTYITSGMICYGYLLSDFRKYKTERSVTVK